MTFGEKLKTLRNKLNMSQETMAREMNVSFSTINRWERGHNNPGYKAKAAFDKICKQYNIQFKD